MAKILGLDLGTNSIGWALIDDAANKILGIGSRIFPMGVENLGDGDNEISKNASRTGARGVRRQFFRRRLRKKVLLKVLSDNNMCPLSIDDFEDWKSTKQFPSEKLVNWFVLNPYELRQKALTEKLSLEEIGRIFYHLIQRRGFLSNSRKGGSDDGAIFKGNPKEGKIGITDTQESIENKTLGSYLFEIYPKENQPFQDGLERIRNRYTTRKMYVDEFEMIWEKQKQYHPEFNDVLKQLYGGRKLDGYKEDGILFHQRPLRSQKHLVGNCSFEPSKTKCPISAIPFEQFRIWQWVNTVEYNGQKISQSEKEKLVAFLLTNEKPDFKKIRKAIGKESAEFKFNYKDDDKIVARVEELVYEADINKAFRELQDLHRIWKEDIGPVSREHRDSIWNKFSDLTKQMHDKREVLFENQRGTELENLEKKKEIIAKIEVLATEKVNAHSQWLAQIDKVEALRTAFFSAGKVPSDVNEETWASFKTAVRNFNSFKNSFYKDIKKDQNDNLIKKTALVAKAKELQESLDFAATTPIMKQIQDEWKQIGHVPRKYSDKIWKEFKDACNHYFRSEEHTSELQSRP